ncbi:MAG: single-stranded-DNA-specific exonuclease RecJ [Eubacteriales bacterium]|nr:single-stranded-DNA-specific exonuclease RecJ [Eubacteriales bacterium]
MEEKRNNSEKNRKEIIRWLKPSAWQVKVKREADLWETLLRARGLNSPAERELFFDPAKINFHDPFLFRDMQAACELVDTLIRAGKKDFLIFGDYDADGFCAAAILYRYFCAIDLEPRVLIPERLTEGYDLNLEQVATILENRPDLLITVDCGTNAGEAVAALRETDVPVIISDHHQALKLPDRSLCPYINPVIEDETYPFSYLSGAGVALKLALALMKYYPVDQATIDTLYTLAAVATVADIMPLQDENRHLVWFGLQVFSQSAPQGLRQLAQNREISSQVISFQIAPRLNAAGRMGEGAVALDLLLTDDAEQAPLLAAQLESLNSQRKIIEENIFVKSCQQIETEYPEGNPPIVIVHGKDWHLGVLGIVASRLVERYHCPAIVLSDEGDLLKGSGRSYANFNLLALLDFAAADLLQYGGHEQACGLQVDRGRLDALKQSLKCFVLDNSKTLTAQPLLADCVMEINEVSLELIEQLKTFEPVGQGNPAPLFVFPDLLIEQIYAVGQGKHLRLSVSGGACKIDMIGFSLGHELASYRTGDRIDVLGIPEINEYMGMRKPQLRIESLRPSDEEKLNSEAISEWTKFLDLRQNGGSVQQLSESVSLDPDIFPYLWQLLETIGGTEEEAFDFMPSRMARLLREGYNINSSELSLLLAVSVLEEAGLVSLMLEEDSDSIYISMDKAEENKPRLRKTSTWMLLEQCGGIRE